MDYKEKLRNPKWQKKRLEILHRDGFRCNECGEDNKNLQVHHKYYHKNMEPWLYPNESLITLCEECHKDFECIKGMIISSIFCKFSKYNELEIILLLHDSIKSKQDLIYIKDFIDRLNDGIDLTDTTF